MELNFKQFIEASIFNTWKYNMPEDKEQRLYDFYMLFILLGKEVNMRRSVDALSGNMGLEDQLKYATQEAKQILFPALKEHLLNAVFFSLSAEIRHVFALNRAKSVISLTEYDLGKSVAKMVKKYAKEYFLNQQVGLGSSPKLSGKEKERYQKYRKENSGSYVNSYKSALRAIQKSGNSRRDWVKFCEWAFADLSWEGGYGGNAWSKIATGWLKLDSATDWKDMMIWIDHVYDLQHNNGTVFTKLQGYYKDGYEWIKKALDFKRDVKNPWELFDKVSSSMRRLAGFVLKQKTGETWESYQKKKKKEDFAKATKGFLKKDLKDLGLHKSRRKENPQNKPVPLSIQDIIFDSKFRSYEEILNWVGDEPNKLVTRTIRLSRNFSTGPKMLLDTIIAKKDLTDNASWDDLFRMYNKDYSWYVIESLNNISEKSSWLQFVEKGATYKSLKEGKLSFNNLFPEVNESSYIDKIKNYTNKLRPDNFAKSFKSVRRIIMPFCTSIKWANMATTALFYNYINSSKITPKNDWSKNNSINSILNSDETMLIKLARSAFVLYNGNEYFYNRDITQAVNEILNYYKAAQYKNQVYIELEKEIKRRKDLDNFYIDWNNVLPLKSPEKDFYNFYKKWKNLDLGISSANLNIIIKHASTPTSPYAYDGNHNWGIEKIAAITGWDEEKVYSAHNWVLMLLKAKDLQKYGQRLADKPIDLNQHKH